MPLKRFIAISILVFYSVSVSGATLSVHFCGSELQSFSFAGIGHTKCCCGTKVMNSDCCKDIHISIKVKDEHKSVEATTLPISIPQTTLTEIPPFFDFIPGPQVDLLVHNFHSPPIRDGDTKLFILNSVFRI